MSQFKNREKRQAFLFITLGLVISIFSYQNFQYPEAIKKSAVDVDASLDASDLEIQRTRRRLSSYSQLRSSSKPNPALAPPKTQVVEAPMKLQLKRAPAKSSVGKKKSKKSKSHKKVKKKTNRKTKPASS